MIYRATHNFIIYPFFIQYSILKIRKNFHKVFIKGEFREKSLPLLLLSNHISWWDGFWAVYLNMKLFHRKFYFMMLEEQLKKHMFFNRAGGYSVKKGSKSIIETLDYTVSLLADPKNLVLLFPQGKIESLYTDTIRFETGIEYIIKRLNTDIQIIFLVNLVDYFSNPKPGLYMFIKEYEGKIFTTEKMQEEYNRFYCDCISENRLKQE
jgi:1-acyl-sn-glycerol-3-phosphate acyltransferase